MRCSHLHSHTKPFLLHFRGLSEPTGELCQELSRSQGGGSSWVLLSALLLCCASCESPVLGRGKSGTDFPSGQGSGSARALLRGCPCLLGSPGSHQAQEEQGSEPRGSCCQPSEFCWAVRAMHSGWWPWAVLHWPHAHPAVHGQSIPWLSSCRAGAQLLPGLCVCLGPISCSNQ